MERRVPPSYDPDAEMRARGCALVILGTGVFYAAVSLILFRRFRRKKVAKDDVP